MTLDYNAISALAAVIAALVAIVAVWVEGRRSRFSHGLDIILKLDDAFHTEEFKSKRRTVAKLLLKSDKNFDQSKHVEDIEDILNHFEMIGLLFKKGVLDKELVSAQFFYWLHYYCFALKDYIASVRRWEPTAWEEVEWLHEQLIPLEREQRPKGINIDPSKETMKEFLTRESKL